VEVDVYIICLNSELGAQHKLINCFKDFKRTINYNKGGYLH